MDTTRWTNPTQPQTLQSSVILLYISAAFQILFSGGSGLAILIGGSRVAAGWGVANERRWGYQLAIVAALLPFVLLFAANTLGDIIDNLLFLLLLMAFDIVLVALLLHPQSRTYQRIWFK
jgi:hypothetical protein